MEVKIVGSIQFKNRTLPVYGNLDEPLFKATDVAELLSLSLIHISEPTRP